MPDSSVSRYVEWTDEDGQRVVINGDRISIYGSPSMTNDSGQVAIGADIPPGVSVGAESELTSRGLSDSRV